MTAAEVPCLFEMKDGARVLALLYQRWHPATFRGVMPGGGYGVELDNQPGNLYSFDKKELLALQDGMTTQPATLGSAEERAAGVAAADLFFQRARALDAKHLRDINAAIFTLHGRYAVGTDGEPTINFPSSSARIEFATLLTQHCGEKSRLMRSRITS